MGLFEEMNQVLRSPSFRGCLESVLGEDMMVACCESHVRTQTVRAESGGD